MTKIVTLYFILLSFCLNAQVNSNEIKVLQDEISNYEKVGNTSNEKYISTLNKLYKIYYQNGKYKEAEFILLNILDKRKKNLGIKHPDYLTTLNNLAVVYYHQEKYLDAEISYLKVIDERKNTLDDDPNKTRDYLTTLNNLAEVYRIQKKFTKAKKIYEEAYKISRLKLQDNEEVYISVTNNLALLYVNLKEYELAGEFLIETLELINKNYGRENLMYASTLGNMASLHVYLDEDTEVIIPLLVNALQIRKDILGIYHPLYVESLINLATAYKRIEKYNQAEPLLLNSLEISKVIYGVNHQQYIDCLFELSILYRALNLNNKASQYFENYANLNKIRLKEVSSILTEEELINYVISNKLSFDEILSFINDYPIQYPTINLNYFDNELLLKNLSQNNQVLIKKSIQGNGNISLIEKYREYLNNKNKLLKLQELPLNIQPEYIDSLKTEIEQLEKDLVYESASFSEFKREISIDFNDVKNKLKRDEILIDLVSFNYNKSRSRDNVVYAAFIIMKYFKEPKFVTLFNEKQLTFLLARNKIQQDSTQIDKQYLDKAISDLFIKPLEKELKNISTVYLSASGLGHQINFAALPINYNQSLGSKYKLHILSSPAEIIDFKVTGLDKKGNFELLLYGGIDYDKTNSIAKVGTDIAKNNETLKELQTRSGISEFGYLVGSKKEVLSIQGKGTQNGFKTTLFDDRDATEESFKQLDGRTKPYVLHLATHGFFFPDPIQETHMDNKLLEGKSKIFKASDNPMMRSGLLFSGANKTWGKSLENQTLEDGILTASEISNLDLSACQLVVLSACETGLGEVKGSEGVFGLQRAFKMAGVKNIIMSLWKVPDAQTAELFDIFYTECFAGKTIHEAFQTAQAKMKVKYSPYYWAGFVLLE
jgi:CHAT domain-containing protein/tetratricopeptide (TPR) repeat protein